MKKVTLNRIQAESRYIKGLVSMLQISTFDNLWEQGYAPHHLAAITISDIAKFKKAIKILNLIGCEYITQLP